MPRRAPSCPDVPRRALSNSPFVCSDLLAGLRYAATSMELRNDFLGATLTVTTGLVVNVITLQLMSAF